MRKALLAAAIALLFLIANAGGSSASERGDGRKVVVFGIPGVTWKDIRDAHVPTLRSLAENGAVGNVSVRIQNLAGESYAGFGAGLRVQADASSAFAFGVDEVVENSAAADLFERRNGYRPRSASVAVIPIGAIKRTNSGKAFDAKPGLIAETLEEAGGQSAIVGNSDEALGPLPKRLPTTDVMLKEPSPDTGIHREAALAAMRLDGTVANGNVSRSLLRANPDAAFGISASLPAYASELDKALASSRFIVVDTGETMRADIYSAGLAKQPRIAARRKGLFLADRLIGHLMKQIDLSETTVVVIAPTTPGGNEERGQLRPVIVAGPDIDHGLLTSVGTRRAGLISMSDLSATVAKELGIASRVFAGGHAAITQKSEGSTSQWIDSLIDNNLRSNTHDAMRTPVSIFVVGLTALVYAIALARLRRGAMPRWLEVLLLAALAFPVSSFVSHAGIYRAGSWISTASIIALTLVIAWVARRLLVRSGLFDAGVILGLTAAFYAIDLLAGAPFQLDSLFGYTSVAAGRFFGLGNLGFALFSASVLLLAGMVADSMPSRGRWLAIALVVALIVLDGHPALGDDVGGVLALFPAAIAFGLAIFGRGKIKRKHWPLIGVGAVALVLIFGFIDLARPAADRTHLGNFLASVAADPYFAWLVIRRKVLIAVSLAVSSRWGLAAPGAVGVLMALHYRSKGRWHQIMTQRPALKAGLEALIVAAIAGSLLNDSGVAVAGTMLMIAAPWALIVLSRYGGDVPVEV